MSKIVVPVVIDTNVLVPSVFMKSHILKFILNGNLTLVWSDFIFKEALEITERLWNKLYQKKMEPEQLPETIELLETVYRYFGYPVDDEMPEDWPTASKDRRDDPFLWAAETGKAEYIISHDRRHMLELGNHKGIPIGTPAEFFQWAKATHPI